MSKSNIEWCDYSWNPIVGCRHDCPYCYAKVFAKRFAGDVRQNINDDRCIKHENGLYEVTEPFINRKGRALAFPFGFNPTLMSYRLNDPKTWLTGRNIFVGSTADVFGEWVPDEWIESIFNACKEGPQHNYLFLTKNPYRYRTLAQQDLLPKGENMWYGYSFTTTQADILVKDNKFHTFVSIEPILEDIGDYIQDFPQIADWVIIGAETGQHKDKVIPKKEWIDNIISHCNKWNIPVFMKDSLIPIVGEENMRREFPEQLVRDTISEKRKETQVTHCGKCKKKNRKKNMTAILGKRHRKDTATVIGYVCDDCIEDFKKGFNNNDKNVGGGSP